MDKVILTKENFSAAYPELFAEITKEAFEKGIFGGIEEGKLSGAESERERIKSVEEQLLPGHEALITSLKYDGKTTGAEAAVQVLKAEKELMASRHSDLIEDGKKVKVKDAAPPDTEEKKEKDPAIILEAIVKEKMKADKNLLYRDALIEAQKEKPELAKKIDEQLTKDREKK